jgi:hypothetical protein
MIRWPFSLSPVERATSRIQHYAALCTVTAMVGVEFVFRLCANAKRFQQWLPSCFRRGSHIKSALWDRPLLVSATELSTDVSAGGRLMIFERL